MDQNLSLTLIVSTQSASPRTVVELIDLAFTGGVTAVQLREKDLPARDFYNLATEVALFCRQSKRPIIINDRLDLALAVGADGLHLGQDDLPLEVARKFWPRPKTLGATTKTPQAAQKAQELGADYLGIGALFPSPSKPTAPVMALETIEAIKRQVSLPLIGIGGITAENASLAWSWGFDGLAVISAITGSPEPTQAARDILAKRPPKI
ncbi:MAG: thiamine phosphate synthase [Deltaproteobacteria bacterium]|nr:thiamine phosphate synthase [Deltaproteobacteria bacterium]